MRFSYLFAFATLCVSSLAHSETMSFEDVINKLERSQDSQSQVSPNENYAAPSPAPLNQGTIPYVTGGIGKAEREQLYAARSQYNLEIKCAITSGHYLGDVGIIIEDNKGQPILNAMTDGPLFYVKLPTGTYTIRGNYRDQERTQKVSIANSQSPLREVVLRFDGTKERTTPEFEQLR